MPSSKKKKRKKRRKKRGTLFLLFHLSLFVFVSCGESRFHTPIINFVQSIFHLCGPTRPILMVYPTRLKIIKIMKFVA